MPLLKVVPTPVSTRREPPDRSRAENRPRSSLRRSPRTDLPSHCGRSRIDPGDFQAGSQAIRDGCVGSRSTIFLWRSPLGRAPTVDLVTINGTYLGPIRGVEAHPTASETRPAGRSRTPTTDEPDILGPPRPPSPGP